MKGFGKLKRTTLLGLGLTITCWCGIARAGSQDTTLLSQIRFNQRLGNSVPLETLVTNSSGVQKTLRDHLPRRPMLFTLAYASCPNLCGLVFQGISETLRDLPLRAGKDFELVIISLDPHESPANLDSKNQMIRERAGYQNSGGGIHFFSASAPAVKALADSIGFEFVLDPKTQQYLHPSGVVVLTPDGVVSKYFFGVRYPVKLVQASLQDAATARIGTVARSLLLYCFHYDPSTGRYGELIMSLLRLMGVALLLGVGVVWYRQQRSTR